MSLNCSDLSMFVNCAHTQEGRNPSSRATNPRTGGRPSQELAGDHLRNAGGTGPRTGGRASCNDCWGRP
eukprot:9365496-Pyramimonas_sp.AAC.1